MVFFNPNMGTGLKNTTLGLGPTPGFVLRAQDKVQGALGGYTPLPNVYIYNFFVEASTTPKPHIILTRLPFWG